VKTGGRGKTRIGAIASLVIAATVVVAVGSTGLPANAVAAPVIVTVTLGKTSIRADGVDSASVDITATVGGSPVVGAKVKLSAVFTTPKSPGAAHLLPASSIVLDGTGEAHGTVTSLRSGTMNVTATIHTAAYSGTASSPLQARRRSMVVFADGASSFVTCTAPGMCSDAYGLFAPVMSALAGQGFASDDMATFSYAGGAIDPTTHDWIPAASTCAESATSYKTEIGRMHSMLSKLASTHPNTDFSLVGLSQGGILAFQMVGVVKSLPKGSRLASVTTLDSPVGGGPLSLILHLEPYGTQCWSLGGSSPAAQQLQLAWNSTAPNQGPQQGDNATLICALVGLKACATETNEQAVAAVPGIAVRTWGGIDDGAMYPPACGEPSSFDARDSQIVTGAEGGLATNGAVPGPSCVIDSHVAAVNAHVGDILATVGPQQ
jgi:hypothetical protein